MAKIVDKVAPVLQSNWTSVRPGTYLFELAKPRGANKPSTIRSVKYHTELVSADEVIQNGFVPAEPRVTKLSQVKIWQQSLQAKTYLASYGYNLYRPGDLYQVVYVGIPEGFVVRDTCYDIQRLIQKLVTWTDSPEDPAVKVILEGDISGQYYDHDWVDQLTATELEELLTE